MEEFSAAPFFFYPKNKFSILNDFDNWFQQQLDIEKRKTSKDIVKMYFSTGSDSFWSVQYDYQKNTNL